MRGGWFEVETSVNKQICISQDILCAVTNPVFDIADVDKKVRR